MAVMARETWTDERLDDLAAQTDKRFDRVDADIRELRADMNKGFDRVDTDVRELRAEMKKGFTRVDDKFDSLQSEMKARFESVQRTMIIGFVTLFAGIVASVIGVAFAV